MLKMNSACSSVHRTPDGQGTWLVEHLVVVADIVSTLDPELVFALNSFSHALNFGFSRDGKR